MEGIAVLSAWGQFNAKMHGQNLLYLSVSDLSHKNKDFNMQSKTLILKGQTEGLVANGIVNTRSILVYTFPI